MGMCGQQKLISASATAIVCMRVCHVCIFSYNSLQPDEKFYPPFNRFQTDQNDWLVSCFGLNGPLRQYFSLYRAVSQREGERGEKRIDENKNVQTTPIRSY